MYRAQLVGTLASQKMVSPGWTGFRAAVDTLVGSKWAMPALVIDAGAQSSGQVRSARSTQDSAITVGHAWTPAHRRLHSNRVIGDGLEGVTSTSDRSCPASRSQADYSRNGGIPAPRALSQTYLPLVRPGVARRFARVASDLTRPTRCSRRRVSTPLFAGFVVERVRWPVAAFGERPPNGRREFAVDLDDRLHPSWAVAGEHAEDGLLLWEVVRNETP